MTTPPDWFLSKTGRARGGAAERIRVESRTTAAQHAAQADPAYAFFLETAVIVFKVVLRLHRSGKPGSLAGIRWAASPV